MTSLSAPAVHPTAGLIELRKTLWHDHEFTAAILSSLRRNLPTPQRVLPYPWFEEERLSAYSMWITHRLSLLYRTTGRLEETVALQCHSS